MNELTEQHKESDEQVKAFLGDARYAQYKDYNETMADDVEPVLGADGGGRNPLSAEQTSQLLEIMKQEKKGVAPVFGEPGSEAANWQAMMSEDKMNELFKQQGEINQRVLERAKAVLSQEQLNAFAAHQTSQLSMQRMGMTMAVKVGEKKSEDTTPVKEKPCASADSLAAKFKALARK